MTTLEAAALLLDMDGTIVDSTAVVEAIWERFAAERGIDLPELLAYSHGRRTPDTLAHFLPDATEAERAQVCTALESSELEDLVGIREVAGAGALLRSLGDIPWAVVTSATRELATRRMRAAGLPDVPVLMPADEIERGKPDPDGYEKAAAALGIAPADCIVFEDADAGIRAGLAAGAQVVVVGTLAAPAADGLPRVADLRGVRARRDGDRVVVDL